MASPLRSVHVPHLGRHMKLGVRPGRVPGLALRIGEYLREIPPPPDVVSFWDKASAAMSDALANDAIGDCEIAALLHLRDEAAGDAGSTYRATRDEAVSLYSAITGYDPNAPADATGNNPTDQGTDPVAAMNYCATTGFADGSKVQAWAAVDANNFDLVAKLIYIFEGGMTFAIMMPDAWVSPFPSGAGFVWDDAGDPNPSNGHAIAITGFDRTRGLIEIDTWGLRGDITTAAATKYAVPSAGGALYVVLTPDLIARGQANSPEGLDWTALLADFAALTGQAPPAPPAPVPATLATAQQLQGLLASGGDASVDPATIPALQAPLNAFVAANLTRKP